MFMKVTIFLKIKNQLAISVTIQSLEKTLNDNDLEKINNLIIKQLKIKLVLRSDLKKNEHN